MNKPIRILHIVTYMGRGGLESMLMNYYRNIDRSKVQFDFLVHRDFKADYDDEILSLGGKIYHISRLVPWSKTYKNELKSFFNNHPEYQIIHVHQDCLSAVALKCAKECGIPVRVAHAHSSSAVKNFKYPIKLHYMKKIYKYATDLFACGKQAGDWMFTGHDYTIVKNAIDLDKYKLSSEMAKETKKQFHIEDKYVIGHVGCFREEKNHIFLVDVFNEVRKMHSDSVLLLVGDGEKQEEIKQKVKELGLENDVIFTGSRADVNLLMQAMDVFVFPSLYEGLGMVFIEAQASGLHCIVSDSVPSESILLPELVCVKSLNDSVKSWAEEVLNRKKISDLNFSNLVRSGYDIKKECRKLEEFYLNSIQKR